MRGGISPDAKSRMAPVLSTTMHQRVGSRTLLFSREIFRKRSCDKKSADGSERQVNFV